MKKSIVKQEFKISSNVTGIKLKVNINEEFS